MAKEKATFTGEEKRILAFSSACHFLSHMLILVFPSVTMPLVHSLEMPLEDVVKISFLMYLLYGLCALPVGYIVDRWQARKMLLYGLVAMGSGLLLASVSPGKNTLSMSFMLVGIGASVYHPAGLSLISHTIQRRGRALAINGVFGNLGICSAPFLTGLLTWAFSWRAALALIGGMPLAAAALLAPLRMDESLRRLESSQQATSQERLKYFVILCVALVLGGLVYRGNMVLLPAYLELKTKFFHELIVSLSFIKLQGTKTLAATTLTSLIFLAGILGQLLGGRIADRHDLRYGYLFVHAASLPFLFAMAFTGNYLLVIGATLYTFFNFASQPLENSLIASLTPARWRSTSFAMKFILNFGVGSSVVYLISPVKNAFSLETVYVFLSGIALLLVTVVGILILSSRKTLELRN